MTPIAAATTHRHRHTATTTTERPYRGPVAVGIHQNTAAHGNVERTERCPCGAQRLVLVNGRHRESTGWT